MSYNFFAKEAKVREKIKTLITSTRRCFSTLTHAFSGGFLAQKSIGSFKDLSKLSSTLQHLLITSECAIGSGDILVASSIPSYLKDGCCRRCRGWIRAHKGEIHVISGNSLDFHLCNDSKEALDLLATRSYTCPVFLDLGGTRNSFRERRFKVPDMKPEFLPLESFTRWIIR